ncbi:hypothetical protein PDESU_06107 [Pontiella desulfatans]|uniref:Uncharacterized protein n=1 Tax=Pontiella desulfatans TaxID=2750659 RepID=A0A6C2UBP3_PONDE|nr:hypothetical protein [Pontiella desulfatans]VGO17510.1 hypothetical protein PDESU_06107 [Pontiella desulfatans]
MKLQVPWRVRLRNGRQGNQHDGKWWNRRKYRDDPESNTVKSAPLHEDDLNHLGALHRTGKD